MTNNAKGLALTSLGVFIMSLESLFIKFTTISPFLFSFYIGIFMFISMISTFIFEEIFSPNWEEEYIKYIGIVELENDINQYINIGLKEKILKKALNTNLPMMIVCAILMGTSNIFFITAVKTTTVANVVIIFSTAALFSALFAYLFYREKITKNIIVASFFMFVGLFIIFNDKLEIGSIEGNIYALLCTAFFATSYVILL